MEAAAKLGGEVTTFNEADLEYTVQLVQDLVIPMHGSWWTRCKFDRTMRLDLWCKKWYCCGFDRFILSQSALLTQFLT